MAQIYGVSVKNIRYDEDHEGCAMYSADVWYNIGARYFIREILKSLSATARLRVEAKVPQCRKRSTCTLSTLFSLRAALRDFGLLTAEFSAVS